LNGSSLALVLTGVLLNAIAQLCLKAGSAELVGVPLNAANAGALLVRLAQNGPILGGLACYAVSVVVWIVALARVDVSIAYPMLSLGYIVNALGAWWLFDENVTLVRVTGMVVIGVGTWLVAQS
jgi:multidrug transporter EmrE-like cation transporter